MPAEDSVAKSWYKENGSPRVAFWWIRQEKKINDKSRKKWLNGLDEDLRVVSVVNWKSVVQDMWRDNVVAAKTFKE